MKNKHFTTKDGEQIPMMSVVCESQLLKRLGIEYHYEPLLNSDQLSCYNLDGYIIKRSQYSDLDRIREKIKYFRFLFKYGIDLVGCIPVIVCDSPNNLIGLHRQECGAVSDKPSDSFPADSLEGIALEHILNNRKRFC